jgi:hypothetical protein
MGYYAEDPVNMPVNAISINMDGARPGERPIIVITGKDFDELSYYRVGQWPYAYKENATTQNIEIKGPDSNNHDFIDRDPNRFYIWVKDESKWTITEPNGDPTHKHITASISTINTPLFSNYDDNKTEISLARYTGEGKSNGWYMSDSQLLVSNANDYSYSDTLYLRPDNFPPAGDTLVKDGRKWLVSDRTHIIALGGLIQTSYHGTVKEALCKNLHELLVNVHIVEADGVNISAAMLRATNDIKHARELLAQVGISIAPAVIGSIDPIDVDTSDGLNTKYSDIHGIVPSDEEKALLDHAEYRTSQLPNGRNDIEIYYVKSFDKPTLYGYAFPHSRLDALYKRFADTVILSLQRNDIFQVLAHEICHILENLSINSVIHYPYGLLSSPIPVSPSDRSNLMVEGERMNRSTRIINPTPSEIDSRRLYGLQELDIRFNRPDLAWPIN